MTTPTIAAEDIATVRSVFAAFASRDLAALSTLFHQDATWHHRNHGRSFDDPQVALFTVEDGRVRSVEQYVGDPAAVSAFWA
jgi:ketosteroid isomerase-like protein